MISETRKRAISLGCYMLIFVTAVLHICYGVYFIELGLFRQSKSGNNQAYQNTVPLSAFVISVGCFLIISLAFCIYCLFSRSFSWSVQLILWNISWINVALTFTVAMLEVRQYVRQSQAFLFFGKPLPKNHQFQIPLNLGLADGIISFVLGFPACLVLMFLANARLSAFEKLNALQIVAGGQKQQSSLEQERQASESITQSKHLTRMMAYEPSGAISKAIQQL